METLSSDFISDVRNRRCENKPEYDSDPRDSGNYDCQGHTNPNADTDPCEGE
mgnify:CR=1 FL=1